MRSCPTCKKVYPDPSLNFCLDDGSVLVGAFAPESQATVAVNRSSEAFDQSATMVSPLSSPAGWNIQPQRDQPKKRSSKMWIVAVLILGSVVLLCGGGAVGLYIIGSQSNSTVVPDNPPAIGRDLKPNTSADAASRNDENKIDLSAWGSKTKEFGSTEYIDGELQMAARGKGYYYVLIAMPGAPTTNEADVSLNVRNLTGGDTKLGYGLIFHSKSSTPLEQDYAFLIDSAGQRYRIAYHQNKVESTVVDWTTSTSIKGGSAENLLEVKDLSDKIEFYINGTMVTSIRNVYGHPAGVPGIYSGDGLKVGFSGLTVRR
jgi:hypothetical protein